MVVNLPKRDTIQIKHTGNKEDKKEWEIWKNT